METNVLEIEGVINECFYYIKRINYQLGRLKRVDKSYLELPNDTYDEAEKFNERQVKFANECRAIHLKIKPLFTQLILDLFYLLQFSLYKEFSEKKVKKSFIRQKRNNTPSVETIYSKVEYFRDAIVHPEHKKYPSPRVNPKHPEINNWIYGIFIPNGNDYYYRSGAEGRIYLKKDIVFYLKEMSKILKKY